MAELIMVVEDDAHIGALVRTYVAKPFSPRELAARVKALLSPGQTRPVEVHVAQLRKKLGRPDLIRTVRGLGYKAAT
jgi:DNA-binding response OmpR family regulator